MTEEQIRRDIEYLAGTLGHRGSNTRSERTASEYIYGRLLEFLPETELDEFYSIETFHYLFAAYYGEFFVIALIAIWFPWVALAYGTVVFTAYLAEFTGYRVIAGLLPEFETQNVIARRTCEEPARLFVVTAHYDTGKAGPLGHPRVFPRIREVHLVIVLCMITVLVTCATQALGTFENASIPGDVVLCWGAVLCLGVAASALLYGELTGDYTRGATDNASGVATLLALGERFHANPLDKADVWLVATGSHEAWMNGMRHLIASQRFNRDTTFFLNLDHLGGDHLRYVTGEGMLHVFRSSPDMVEAARTVAAAYHATPIVWKGLPSDALIPLTRGFNALTITAAHGHDAQTQRRRYDDNLARVDYATVTRAVDFAEDTLRQLARDLGQDR